VICHQLSKASETLFPHLFQVDRLPHTQHSPLSTTTSPQQPTPILALTTPNWICIVWKLMALTAWAAIIGSILSMVSACQSQPHVWPTTTSLESVSHVILGFTCQMGLALKLTCSVPNQIPMAFASNATMITSFSTTCAIAAKVLFLQHWTICQ
jgi:hypothetical protein